MSVKRFLSPRRPAPASDDVLAINSRTWHQYYSTVQSDVYPHMLLEQAMERREARAWQARRQRPLRWVLLATLVVAGAVWWLGVA